MKKQELVEQNYILAENVSFICTDDIFFSNKIVCVCSVTQSCLTLCDPMNHSTPGLPVHHQLRSPPKPMSTESVMPSNHLILCCPLFLLPSIILSIRVFSDESALHIRWPKYWSFSFSISPSNELSGSELSGSDGKASVCNAGDPGSIPGLGRSPVEREGYPFQFIGRTDVEAETPILWPPNVKS